MTLEGPTSARSRRALTREHRPASRPGGASETVTAYAAVSADAGSASGCRPCRKSTVVFAIIIIVVVVAAAILIGYWSP
jgi:hypothetical protein